MDVVSAEQCLTNTEQIARRVWHYKGAVCLDKMVIILMCALDDCCKCAFVSGSASGSCEGGDCGVIDFGIGQE